MILVLHFIPSIFEDIAYFDMFARGYNRHLIIEGFVTENIYNYYFDMIIEDIGPFKNRIEDIILWIIIGYVLAMTMIYIKVENNSKKDL